jgi:hypothetical protein
MSTHADHVTVGWNADHTLRWIEAGHLRLEEDKNGACVFVQPRASGSSGWLSAAELAGLVRQLSSWFLDDPVEQIRQIESCATFVKAELEAWDERARIDEEHPPYDQLARTLDMLLGTCKRLREEGIFADRPTKMSLPSLASRLRDPDAEKHTAFPAFCRQMQGRVYGDEPLNQAWDSFKKGWA